MKHIFALFLMSLWSTFSSWAASSEVSNRVLLALNNIPYTQRQLEIHYYVKSAMFFPDTPVSQEKLQSSWAHVIISYSEDLLVLQDLLRLSSYVNQPPGFQEIFKKVTENELVFPSLNRELSRLDCNEGCLRKSIENLLNIESFFQRKKTPYVKKIQAASTSETPIPWLEDLKRRFTIRYMSQAFEYLDLKP